MIKAFDGTKAGFKGLVDAKAAKVPTTIKCEHVMNKYVILREFTYFERNSFGARKSCNEIGAYTV